MLHCPHCRYPLVWRPDQPEAAVCPECGGSLDADSLQEQRREMDWRLRWSIRWFGLSCLLLGLVAATLSRRGLVPLNPLAIGLILGLGTLLITFLLKRSRIRAKAAIERRSFIAIDFVVLLILGAVTTLLGALLGSGCGCIF